MLEEVMDKLIQPEALIVLVNHPSALIQQGVMKEQKEKFLKNHGFSLLANQLYLHQGSQGLLECFLEMLFGRPISLEEDLDLEDMENISPFRKRCIIPILGLIENSLYENALLHNVLCMLLQLLNACPKLADILLDHGLLYALFNTLSTLNGMENGIPLNDYKLLVCDIQQLLVAVTIHSCSSSGSQYFRIIEDLITLLGFMQTSKMRRTQGEGAGSVKDSIIPRIPRQHYCSYGQIPLSPPFSFLSQESPLLLPSSPSATSSFTFHPDSGRRRRFSMVQSDSLLMRMRSVASDELSQMMQRRMSQENPIRASETEFVQRLQRLVVLADDGGGGSSSSSVARLPHPLPAAAGQQEEFQKEILRLMMEGIRTQPAVGRILWSSKDTFRVQIGRLLVHTLSPAQPLRRPQGGARHGPKLALYLYELLHDHKESLSREEQNAAAAFMTSLKLLIQRLDGKSRDISKIAADITQNVSLRQGMERKKVIQHIRGLYKTDLGASRRWQELVQQHTHDRAVWYDQMSYPTSWQLDPTEGPNRERRRLQRCYLTIPNKYLLKDRRKPEDAVKPPLSFLFEDNTHSSFSSTVKDKATSEPIRFTRRCISVAPSVETAGELLLGKSGMYFVEDNATDAHDSQIPHGELEAASFSWTYEEIKEVHKRWWQLRDNAAEIFLTNGRTLLLAFDNTKFRDDVYHNILTSDLPNLLEHGNISALTQLWGSGQISNFEYLTHLNKHAGRSFNDLMQYPVFPFILRDYTSETLDLQDPAIYSGTVLHFMVRMPPFTKMFLAYQDQSFDIPDRTFHSMNTTWRLSSFDSSTCRSFDFGLRQNGERVNHVNLPPWARNDPRLFVLVHRQALESDQVSQTLCQWIDLVFGLKQKGKAAVHAINVFHPATYFGMDVSAVEDPVQRRALETMIKTYGQTPRQLFSGSHVSRAGPRLLMDGELPAAVGLLVQLAFRENREQAKEIVYPVGVDGVDGSPLPWIKGLKWGEYVGSPSAPDPVVCFSQPHGERFGSLLALPTRAICGLSRNKQSEPPINFIQCSQLHQPSEMEVESQVHLYGHTGEVTSLFVCKPYSVLISSLTGHKNPVTAVSASETTGDIATQRMKLPMFYSFLSSYAAG
ncbi:hypothetical protein CRUP_004735 [Coryphaenoides rupestris]|nr:hypothetical protein CRUP_004735 [Coryphaenoides rupestris]